MSGKFVGDYVPDLVLAIVASNVAGINLVFKGPPGYGKTEIIETVLQAIYGDRWVSLFLNPSTSPEDVGGRPDMALLLSPESKYEIVLDNTVFDPRAFAVLLDEATRANDPVWDLLLKPLSGRGLDNKRLPEGEVKVFLMTENWSLESDRTEALRDRVGIKVTVPDPDLPIGDLVDSALDSIGSAMEVDDGLPTIEDIQRIRAYKPSEYPKSKKAIKEVLKLLAAEVNKGNVTRDEKGQTSKYKFKINPRRVKQWSTLLFRFSAFLTGKPDFDRVPDKAKRVLQWMWPTKDDEEARAWENIVKRILDPVQEAIDSMVEAAYKAANAVTALKDNDTAEYRMHVSTELGKVLANGEEQLVALARQMDEVDEHDNPTDARIKKAIKELRLEFGEMMRKAARS